MKRLIIPIATVSICCAAPSYLTRAAVAHETLLRDGVSLNVPQLEKTIMGQMLASQDRTLVKTAQVDEDHESDGTSDASSSTWDSSGSRVEKDDDDSEGQSQSDNDSGGLDGSNSAGSLNGSNNAGANQGANGLNGSNDGQSSSQGSTGGGGGTTPAM